MIGLILRAGIDQLSLNAPIWNQPHHGDQNIKRASHPRSYEGKWNRYRVNHD